MEKVLKKIVITAVLSTAGMFKALSFFNTSGSCRFTPTCSAYAVEAIEVLSLQKAIIKIIIRIIRCNPLSKGGYDPVRK